MKLLSVNTGLPREVIWHGVAVTTGIFKQLVAGRIFLRTLNLDGDRQADLTVHGGPNKAVYCYPAEHYGYWGKELPGVDLSPGAFGENFTTEGLFEDSVHIGDRFRVGFAEVVVTQPRLPCYKLGVKFQSDDMVKRFQTAGRSGFYVAVTREAEVGAGDAIEVIARDPQGVPVSEIARLYVTKRFDDADVASVRRAVRVPALPESWRKYFLERLDVKGARVKFDAIIIGSGQAGNPLSSVLAEHGWSVAQIEKSHLGGTCINTGCTPTKTMVASAQVAHYARDAARWGVIAENVCVDLPAILARKNTVVESSRSSQQRRIDKHPGIRLYRGVARFLSPREVKVGSDVLESERIFINAGTRPDSPKIPGIEAVGALTNESLMELPEVPEHLIVLGGGYIGLEFGQMFRRFGGRVTIVHRGDQILPREDEDVARELQKTLEAEDIAFHLNANSLKVEKHGAAIVLTVDVGGTVEIIRGTHLLAATGRRPNTDTLDIEKAGVALDSHGYIKVNDRLETGVPGIWALGDVKGGPAFTHISYNDYQIVYANLIEGKNLSTKNRYLPYSLFTDPQLGRVGMTEREARASGRKLKMGTFPMSYVARAIERGETAGFMKIIVDAADDRILGASILGIEGGELVQILGALILAGAPYTVLKQAVFIHPTLAEGFFGLLDAVKPVS